jgi:hypothetical protein
MKTGNAALSKGGKLTPRKSGKLGGLKPTPIQKCYFEQLSSESVRGRRQYCPRENINITNKAGDKI